MPPVGPTPRPSRTRTAAQLERKRTLDREGQRVNRQRHKESMRYVESELAEIRLTSITILGKLERLCEVVATRRLPPVDQHSLLPPLPLTLPPPAAAAESASSFDRKPPGLGLEKAEPKMEMGLSQHLSTNPTPRDIYDNQEHPVIDRTHCQKN